MSAESVLTKQAQTLPSLPTVPALLTKAMIRRFYVPAGERTLDRWISSGTFPRPDIAIGGKVRYWKRETIEAWIESQTRGLMQ